MSEAHNLKQRIAREVASRKAAEQLLEAKSLELFLKNNELQNSVDRLRQQVDHLVAIMDAVPDVVITCNEDYVIETVNESALSMLGCAPDALLGVSLTAIVPNLLDHCEALSRASFILSDIGVHVENGRNFNADLRGRRTQLYDKTMIVIVMHDMSERKAGEKMKEEILQQLHESRRLEAIGALASGLSHELNTPIQFIGDNIRFVGTSLEQIYASYLLYDALKRRCEAEGQQPELVQQVNDFNRQVELETLSQEIMAAMRETVEGVRQVHDVVVLMKEFSHPGASGPEPNDVHSMIKGALVICRGRIKNIVTVETELHAASAIVTCRKGQIQQVLINLIVNAVEAIEETGRRDGRVKITTMTEGERFRIEISDTGPGVPQALREKIFNPFFTTKDVGKGTGQGLALAKDIIVQKHRGRLFLQDKPGFSTCFVIELPAQRPQAGQGRERRANATA